jgi:hypothetical protein
MYTFASLRASTGLSVSEIFICYATEVVLEKHDKISSQYIIICVRVRVRFVSEAGTAFPVREPVFTSVFVGSGCSIFSFVLIVL